MNTFDVELRIRRRFEAANPNAAMNQLLERIETAELSAETDIEYFIRRVPTQASVIEKAEEGEGDLKKPVYTVAEAAQILGVSNAAMYQLVASGSTTSIRLGKRSIRIPRAAIAAMLEGKSQPPRPTIPQQPASERRALPAPSPPSRALGLKTTPQPEKPAKRHPIQKPSRRKEILNVGEAAGFLHVSAVHVRKLLEQKKIFYTLQGSKILIPRRAVEIFAEGRPPIDAVEENIAFYKSSGGWDEEMEEAARALRKEWK